MKKTILTTLAGLTLSFGFAQTATNWTVNDCAGNPHTLFTELDAGKVVVLTWVMPCGACITPAVTASNTVTGMANPNVVYYLCDDYANSSCNTLSNWASSNSITANALFSNNAIDMTDYGSTGMPKTIVLGGSSHTVFYNVSGAVSQSALTTAINNALNAAIGITETNKSKMELSVFPNPAATNTKINYTLAAAAEVTIEVTNMLGAKVSSVSLGKQAAGKQSYDLNLATLPAGSYFVKLNAGETTEIVKITVTR